MHSSSRVENVLYSLHTLHTTSEVSRRGGEEKPKVDRHITVGNAAGQTRSNAHDRHTAVHTETNRCQLLVSDNCYQTLARGDGEGTWKDDDAFQSRSSLLHFRSKHNLHPTPAV